MQQKKEKGRILWSYQPQERVEILIHGEPVIPDWTGNPEIRGSSLSAYQYIAQCYSKDIKGLIFGHIAESKEELVDNWMRCGAPSGAIFADRPLLKIYVPEDVRIMVIDFYCFSDLMFSEEEKFSEQELECCKKHLFLPNGKTYQLPIGHIPYILPGWNIEIFPPNCGKPFYINNWKGK